jgi:predicted  nucleic acid-binding Zn-ribbon protein
MEEHTKTLVEIKSQIQHILDGIEGIKEKQIALAEDITRIKEAVYHPDVGLYARLRELDARIKILESYRTSTSKLLWLLIATALTLSFGMIKTHILN